MKKQGIKQIVALCFTAIMAIGTTGLVLGAETVNVSIERTTGGAVMASYAEGSSEVYLPIGETTAVPKGKKVKVWTSVNGFMQEGGRSECSYLTVNGEDVAGEHGLAGYSFEAQEDTNITAGFTTVPRQTGSKGDAYAMEVGYWTDSVSSDEMQYFQYQPDPGLMNQRLALYFNGTKVDFSQASANLLEVYGVGASGNGRDYNPGQFTLSADGMLSSNSALDYGTYEFYISVNYGGVQEDLNLNYTVGIEGAYNLPIYEISANGRTRYGTYGVITFQLNSGSTVGDLVNAYYEKVNKTIAGYEIVGWKNPATGMTLAENTSITSLMEEGGSITICPIFQRKSDGHIYQVVLQ